MLDPRGEMASDALYRAVTTAKDQIAKAIFLRQEAIEISKLAFDHMKPVKDCECFTNGSPGIKVFAEGTMDRVLRDEAKKIV